MIKSLEGLSLENFAASPINVGFYQKEMDEKYGIVLDNLKHGVWEEGEKLYTDNVVFMRGLNQDLDDAQEKVLDRYAGVSGFCSMRVKNLEELRGHVKNIYELSYAHYFFAMVNGIRGPFPNFACLRSSMNGMFNGFNAGYPNSALLYNKKYDHAVNAFPFIFGDKEESGFIVSDPTSDQLFKSKKNAIKNNVFVVKGKRWSYSGDGWKDGADLFPEGDGAYFLNLAKVRDDICCCKNGYDMNEYFEKVFENVVDVDVRLK